MAEQIECVGGPLDGRLVVWISNVTWYQTREGKREHAYHYNPTTNTYQYKGVRK